MAISEAQYRILLRAPNRALQQMLLDFQFFVEDRPGFVVLAKESRLKSFQSATARAKKLGIDVSELNDLAGARIVVGTSHDVDVVRRFFTRQEVSKDLTVEANEAISRDDGYRSHHMVLVYPGRYSRSVYQAKIEVQIPTVFQYAFNNLSRAWIYKTNYAVSESWSARFAELAADLDVLNDEASRLYEDVVESAMGDDPSAPLTPLSFQLIVQSEFGEYIPIDEAVDSVGFVVDHWQITTNGQLRRFLRDDEMAALWLQYRQAAESGVESARIMSSSRWFFYTTFYGKNETAREWLSKGTLDDSGGS